MADLTSAFGDGLPVPGRGKLSMGLVRLTRRIGYVPYIHTNLLAGFDADCQSQIAVRKRESLPNAFGRVQWTMLTGKKPRERQLKGAPHGSRGSAVHACQSDAWPSRLRSGANHMRTERNSNPRLTEWRPPHAKVGSSRTHTSRTLWAPLHISGEDDDAAFRPV